MLNRLIAAALFATAAASAAQAGTLQNGTWTPSCELPGDAPTFSSKSPDAYNASAKAAQAWQEKAKAYADCLNNEAKTDQQAIITVANGNVKTLSDQIAALNSASADAVEKLKKKGASK
jgi:accessory colonization factor AcfC